MVLEEFRERNRIFVGVCSYGRSGSTFLMECLRAVGVSVMGDLPYEDRTNQAAFLAWHRLNAGMPRAGASGADDPFCEPHEGVQYYAAFDLASRGAGDLARKYGAYLDTVCKAGVHGIAEKFVGFGVLDMLVQCGHRAAFKPIFLIRDPRDVFISVKQFNAKRGFKSFNETAAGDDQILMRLIADFEQLGLRKAEQLRGLECRYEDLIARRPQMIVSLLNYLGIDIPSGNFVMRIWNSLRIEAANRSHMTSASPEDSVGRWKKREFREYWGCFEECHDRVARLGYS